MNRIMGLLAACSMAGLLAACGGSGTAADAGTSTDAADAVDPGPGDPGTTDPGPTDPGATDPGSDDAEPMDPGTTDPGPIDPGVTDPGVTDPGATDPGTADPGETDPGVADPGPTDPGVTDPGPTDPGTTDPGTDTGPSGIWYVDGAATGNGTGTSWANAFRGLQAALDAAVAGDEIRVAEGRYLPSRLRDAAEPRSRTFVLKDGVAVRGGWGGTLTKVRNLDLYRTVLSGDIDGDDINDDGNGIAETWEDLRGENVYTVVEGTDLGAGTLLDGVVVTGGFADHPDILDFQFGAGLRLIGGAPVLKNVVVAGNSAPNWRHDGGGLYVQGGSPEFLGVTISGNFAYGGGGAYLLDSTATFRQSTLQNNVSRTAGGGIRMVKSSLVLDGVSVRGNVARSTGGGIDAWNCASLDLSDVEIRGNLGGGIIASPGVEYPTPQVRIRNGLFAGNNSRASTGGGLYLLDAETEMVNVLFHGNRTMREGAAFWASGGKVTVVNGTFAGNGSLNSGTKQVFLWHTVPTFRNTVFWGAGRGSQSGAPDEPDIVYDHCYTDWQVDPGFVDPRSREDTPTEEGDYRLGPTALAAVIDTGDAALNPLAVDLDGRRRVVGAAIDLGAYERQATAGARLAAAPAGGPLADALYEASFTTRMACLPPPPRDPFALTGLAPAPADARTWHVDARATGGNTGLSWMDAFQDLEAALQAAAPGDQVWIAQGVYVPTRQQDPARVQSATFLLPTDVAIYGGFAGTETALAQRDPTLHPTVLSGDLARDDADPDGDGVIEQWRDHVAPNAENVMVARGRDTRALVDGVVVTGSFGSSRTGPGNVILSARGGGLLVEDRAEATVRGSTFIGCESVYGGALAARYHARLVLEDVQVRNGAATSGTAVYAERNASVTITGATFRDGTFTKSGAIHVADYADLVMEDVEVRGHAFEFTSNSGGGLTATYDARVTAQRCRFLDNTAEAHGGLSVDNWSTLSLWDSEVRGNRATTGLGVGGIALYESKADLVNVLITGNHAVGPTGGLFVLTLSEWDPAVAKLVNVTMTGNRSDFDYRTSCLRITNGRVVARNSILVGGINDDEEYDWLDAQDSLRSAPDFVDPRAEADAPTSEGDYRLRAGSAGIDGGSDAHLPAGVDTDLDGGPRIAGARVDLGPYEYRTVVFVDGRVAASGDGRTWATAYKTINAGLGAAAAGHEVWVAEGVYLPGRAGDRTRTFTLKDGVGLYGGFAGTETFRDQADPVANRTVLSGDLNGDDPADADGVLRTARSPKNDPAADDNVYHVVTAGLLRLPTVLDGFAITGGYADGTGDDGRGGGLRLADAGTLLKVRRVLLSGNAAQQGGGAWVSGGAPTFQECEILSNSAAGEGGGMSLADGADPLVRESRFQGNTAGQGGAVHAGASAGLLLNVLVAGNRATQGAGLFLDGSSTRLYATTVAGNRATGTDTSGGLHVRDTASQPAAVNLVLWGNLPAAVRDDGGRLSASHCIAEGGLPGTSITTKNPLFVAPADPATAPTPAGDHRLQAGSPAIDAGLDFFRSVLHQGVRLSAERDLEGNHRPLDGDGDGTARVDRGCHEAPAVAAP